MRPFRLLPLPLLPPPQLPLLATPAAASTCAGRLRAGVLGARVRVMGVVGVMVVTGVIGVRLPAHALAPVCRLVGPEAGVGVAASASAGAVAAAGYPQRRQPLQLLHQIGGQMWGEGRGSGASGEGGLLWQVHGPGKGTYPRTMTAARRTSSGVAWCRRAANVAWQWQCTRRLAPTHVGMRMFMTQSTFLPASCRVGGDVGGGGGGGGCGEDEDGREVHHKEGEEEGGNAGGEGWIDDEEEDVHFLDGVKPEAQLQAGLYLVGTPIGNLEDITLRALRVLRSASLILAEDTRWSAKLLRSYGIRTPMISYHQFNSTARREATLRRLREGQALALVSDAGMPAISDPGADLVRACAEERIPVFPIPGPTAVTAAVAASGMPCTEFSFLGFPPERKSQREARLRRAANDLSSLVLYAAPHKLMAILNDCCAAFGDSRQCVVAREITKVHEEFWRGTLRDAVQEFGSRAAVKGEVTLVVAGAGEAEAAAAARANSAVVEQRLLVLITAGASPSEATRAVVDELGVKRNATYAAALRIAKQLPDAASSSTSSELSSSPVPPSS